MKNKIYNCVDLLCQHQGEDEILREIGFSEKEVYALFGGNQEIPEERANILLYNAFTMLLDEGYDAEWVANEIGLTEEETAKLLKEVEENENQVRKNN